MYFAVITRYMAPRDIALDELVRAYMERVQTRALPSRTASELAYCSQKLYDVRYGTTEDFDAVMAQYRTLSSRLKDAIGLRLDAFAQILADLKEAYYR